MTQKITPEDIKKLATLSRLATSDAEQLEFAKEIDSIINYVQEINNVAQDETHTQSKEAYPHRNIMREDVVKREVVEDGTIMSKLAPDNQDGYIKVKKIINID